MQQQRGGTFLGFIIGVLIGLAGALMVAVYVTKVPVPFVNKSQSRTAEQDEAEAKKNKDWNPNAVLAGKNAAKPAAPASDAAPATPTPAPVATPAPTPAATASAAAAKPTPVKAEEKKPASADPLGDLAKARAGAEEPQVYFVQVGAYRSMEDAQSQRAKLSLAGVESKVTERDQSGNTIYRVRVGPFEKKEDAERNKEKLEKAGLDTSLLRLPRDAH